MNGGTVALVQQVRVDLAKDEAVVVLAEIAGIAPCTSGAQTEGHDGDTDRGSMCGQGRSDRCRGDGQPSSELSTSCSEPEFGVRLIRGLLATVIGDPGNSFIHAFEASDAVDAAEDIPEARHLAHRSWVVPFARSVP